MSAHLVVSYVVHLYSFKEVVGEIPEKLPAYSLVLLRALIGKRVGNVFQRHLAAITHHMIEQHKQNVAQHIEHPERQA